MLIINHRSALPQNQCKAQGGKKKETMIDDTDMKIFDFIMWCAMVFILLIVFGVVR